MKFYLASGFVVVQVHQITDVLRFLLDGLLGSVDKLSGELDPVSNVITLNFKKKKKKYIRHFFIRFFNKNFKVGKLEKKNTINT
jgi:hypothetical protein